MQALNKGEYTGDVISCIDIDGSIISNTHYSAKKNSSDWHCHKNPHVCFVFEGGQARAHHDSFRDDPNENIFFYHSGEKHRWVSPNWICNKKVDI